MVRLHAIGVVALLLLLGAVAPISACETDECPDLSQWFPHSGRYTLKVSHGDTAAPVEWVGEYSEADGSEIRITETRRSGDEILRAEMGVVGGNVLLVRGMNLENEPPIDRLDQPILHLKLALAFLSRAFPGGPSAVPRGASIDLNETARALEVGTPSGRARIAVPWRLSGAAETDEGGRLRFALEVAYRLPGRDREDHLSSAGTLEPTSGFRWSDDAPLDGWTILQLGYGESRRDGSTIFDFAARPMAVDVRTIGDIRKFVAARDSIDTPDPSRDFSGYWKTECRLGFGLEILRSGTDAPYTIGFCGPGGCDSLADRRRSHITGDSRYEIIDADTLRIGGDVRHRCAPRYDGPGKNPIR
jgi:hypothetical protein